MSSQSKPLQHLLGRLRTMLDHTKTVNQALEYSRSDKQQDRAILNHARKRNAESAHQLVYTHFTEYLRGILFEMYQVRPLEIVTKFEGSLKYDEIVELGSFEAISHHMLALVFGHLEAQRSMWDLLDSILDDTDTDIEEIALNEAIMYVEIRHLLVHNNGLVDSRFETDYGEIHDLKAGKKLNLSIGSVRKAAKAISDVCLQIDESLITQEYIPQNDGDSDAKGWSWWDRA